MRNPLVHLELHTPELSEARGFYRRLCAWDAQPVDAGERPYLSLDLASAIGGGIVECGTPRALWLPYVEVEEIGATTERARALGAAVLLEPRECPAGWRSVVRSAAGGEIALWQPKRRVPRHR